MMKYGIIYGSATGTTKRIANLIAQNLEIKPENVHDVSEIGPSALENYEILILGTSTWGDGEVEEDWYDLLVGLQGVELKDKKIALFGCGDETMTDTFCNGVGELYRRLLPTGASFIAPFNTLGYDFRNSSAIIDGQAVGLLLDEVNHAELTESRIKDWTALIIKE